MAPRSGRPHPTIRLLFDEQTSPKVARALDALGLNVDYVGGTGQPKRGAPDEDVLAHAVRCNQVVVTSNHDFIVLCCDQGRSVVWLDGRGSSLTFVETVLRCFGQVEDWQREIVNRGEAACIQSLKSKVKVLTPEDARRLALARNRKRLARQRREARRQIEGQESTDT